MTRPLDHLLDYLSDTPDFGIESVDHSTGTVTIRAENDRLVSVVISPDGARVLSERTGLDFMGGATPAEKSFGLFTIHLDEMINAFGTSGYVKYEVTDDGRITGVA
ncbi:hypothetical protein [Leifsonia xyli]|uniref:hypothetical protein n=1 Tax=Leifsonia xyli TaxID=1575 RepID=UPI003D675955